MRNMRDYGNPEGVSLGGRMGLPTWLTGGEGSATSYLMAYAAGIALIFPAIYFGAGLNREAPAAAPAEGAAAAAAEPAPVNPMTGDKAPKAVPEIVQKQREAMQRQKDAEEARAQRKAEKREAKKRAGKSAGGASDAGGESTADEQ